MKYPRLLLFIFLLSWSGLSAQNRSIIFIEKPWADIMKMAAEKNKTIFLDAYTSWCGPCKWMAANMFTKDSIADFYNDTFICAHFDMEKGEGVQLARQFQVKAYPTLLFITPAGEMVHKRVGAPQKVSDYLEMGRIALNPAEGLTACQKRYEAGERNPGFLLRYFERLQGAYMPVTGPLKDYFATVPDSELISQGNWKIIYAYSNDMNSREIVWLQKHTAEFSKRYTADSVNQKLYSVYQQALTSQTRSRTFSEADLNITRQKIRDSGFPDAEKVIFTADMTIYRMRGQTPKYLALAYEKLSEYYSDDANMLNEVAWSFYELSSDTAYLQRASEWAKQSVKLKNAAFNNDTYANLLFKLGNHKEAIAYGKTALNLAKKEGIDTTGYEENLKRFMEGAKQQ